jgi:hypothetical protein
MHTRVGRIELLRWQRALLITATTLSARGAFADSHFSATPATAPLVSMHTTLIANHIAPSSTPRKSRIKPQSIPFLTSRSPKEWARIKAFARSNPHAPRGTPVSLIAPILPGSHIKPAAQTIFPGMSDSGSICWSTTGCVPPDGAIAASVSSVMEGVNTSFAVYGPLGVLRPGWPKRSDAFFGIPSPGACGHNVPYTADPRLYYDAYNRRFWAAILQIEGPGAKDNNTCSNLSHLWLAVSQTGDPTGLWYTYEFNLDPSNAGLFGDFTQLGFNGTGACFSTNMFTQSTHPTFRFAALYCADKMLLETGGRVPAAYGFVQLNYNGSFVDTVHPVNTQTWPISDPGVELFVQTFNYNFGGGNCRTSCNGGGIWAMTNPGKANAMISGTLFSTTYSYALPPAADEPGCAFCLDTGDVRISGTPVYRAGSVFLAAATGVNNGAQNVPGILWQEIRPTIAGTISSATTYQGGVFYGTYFGSDQAFAYPTIITDSTNNMQMVFSTSSGTLYPSAGTLHRHVLDPLGVLTGGMIFGMGSTSFSCSLKPCRWGDYNGASWDGFDHEWFEGEVASPSGDWGTEITQINL